MWFLSGGGRGSASEYWTPRLLTRRKTAGHGGCGEIKEKGAVPYCFGYGTAPIVVMWKLFAELLVHVEGGAAAVAHG